MKVYLIFFVLLVGVFSLLSQELLIGYVDEPLPPYTLGVGVNQPDPPGLYVDIINRVAKDLKLLVIYRREPVKRIHLSIEEGKLDAHFSLSYKPDRTNLGEYPMKDGKIDSSKRLASISYYLYVVEGSKVTWDGKTIKNLDKEIGVNLGFSIATDLKNMGYQVNETKSTGGNLKKLQLGVISAYANQDVDTDTLIKTGNYGKIVKLPIPLSTKDYFIIFSNQFMKNNRAIAEKFWNRLSQVRDKVIEERASIYLDQQE